MKYVIYNKTIITLHLLCCFRGGLFIRGLFLLLAAAVRSRCNAIMYKYKIKGFQKYNYIVRKLGVKFYMKIYIFHEGK